MNVVALSRELPNGFHDAVLLRLSMDFIARELVLELRVWVGDMHSAERREAYRPARVVVRDVAYLVLEPPDPKSPWADSMRTTIDIGEGRPSESDAVLPGAPSGTTPTWCYLERINRFLHFAGGEAMLEWTGPEEVRA